MISVERPSGEPRAFLSILAVGVTLCVAWFSTISFTTRGLATVAPIAFFGSFAMLALVWAALRLILLRTYRRGVASCYASLIASSIFGATLILSVMQLGGAIELGGLAGFSARAAEAGWLSAFASLYLGGQSIEAVIGGLAWNIMAMTGFNIAFGGIYLATLNRLIHLDHYTERAEFESAIREAKLQMLRFQLRPHFLFNALNALGTLIQDGERNDAEEMLLNISDFLRLSLDPESTSLKSLSDEVHSMRLYLDVERVRFGDQLQVDWRISPEAGEALVPGLLLQPLIENAVKHGVSRAKNGGSVEISAETTSDRLKIKVCNSLPPEARRGIAVPERASGIGLRNTRERLAAQYGEDALITAGPDRAGEFCVTLDLPLEKQGAEYATG